MSPRDLQPGVVQSRLAQMRLLLDDLDRLGSPTAADLDDDRFQRHVLEHVLVQLIQLAVAVNSHVVAAVLGRSVPDYRSSFSAAVQAGLIDADLAEALAPSVGLRNVLVHEYLDVDLDIVAGAVPQARRDFAAFVASASAWLAARPRG